MTPGSNVVPFPGAFRKNPIPQGEVFVFPCELGGGSWAVEFVPASRETSAFLGTFLSFYDAVAFARRWAAETGAFFEEGLAI
jgi:hypothetical protein